MNKHRQNFLKLHISLQFLHILFKYKDYIITDEISKGVIIIDDEKIINGNDDINESRFDENNGVNENVNESVNENANENFSENFSENINESSNENFSQSAGRAGYSPICYHETVRYVTHNREFSRFRKIVVVALIVSLVGGCAIGFGYGAGTKLAGSYWIPRMASDKKSLRNFSIAIAPDLMSGENGSIYSFSNIIEIVEPSIVSIYTSSPSQAGFYTTAKSGRITGTGTGMLFHETENKYYIVTNAHVVSGASKVFVSIHGSDGIMAKPVGKDTENDIAVISIDKSEAYLAGIDCVSLISFGDSGGVRVGDVVLTIGNAMGEGNSVTNGIISAVDRNIQIDNQSFTVIQTNAAINRGNSGGPLLNLSGQVIGMNTAKLRESTVEGMGYSIPSNIIIPVVEKLMQGGRPMIGIRGGDTSLGYSADYGAEAKGALVYDIVAGSPAEKSGLAADDIITGFNGAPIESWSQLVSETANYKPGDSVDLDILRHGRDKLTLTVVLTEYIDSTF